MVLWARRWGAVLVASFGCCVGLRVEGLGFRVCWPTLRAQLQKGLGGRVRV